MSTLYHSAQPSPVPATSGIYRITCTANNMFYVGSAVDLHKRWMHHCNDLLHNVHHNLKLQRAWNKYGSDAFVFDVLEIVLIPELLTAREQFWFARLRPFGRRGFNLAPVAGSHLGAKRSPESRARMRASKLGKSNHKLIGRKHSPETRKKIGTSQLGKQISLEQREKLRIAHLGKKASEETKRKLAEAGKGRIQRPETIEKCRVSNLGKKRSPETRARISAARTGQKASPETRAKVSLAGIGRPMSPKSRALADARSAARRKTLIVTAPDGTEQTILGIRPFCREHNLSYSALLGVAKGKCRQHKGWHARFPEADVS